MNLDQISNNFTELADLADSEQFDVADENEVCLPIISRLKLAANKKLDNLVYKAPNKEVKVNFIIDSAATINTVSNLNYFDNYMPTNLTITWGKANSLKAKYKGDILIKFNTGYKYLLKDIYYIPELGINLISIAKMPDIIALFMSKKAILYKIINNSKIAIAIANKSKNLFYTEATISRQERGENINIINNNTSASTIIKWHIRLGHINIIPLKVLLKSLGITISKEELTGFLYYKCRVCLLSKNNRQIYRKSINPIKYEILGRIHSDLGGPLPNTYNKYRYYITFLDKKSRFLWITLLTSKDKAYKAFINFKALVENNNNNKRIKEFFTDNGKEFINKSFKNILTKSGILHKTTPAYTKESNGLIERLNLTLFNKVRALLIQSNSPNYLWGEALLSAAYLYNRTPHKALGYKTPFEIYYNIKPNITNIRAWGSIVYYHTNRYLDKLSSRKEEAILVGYSDYNHYKIWDPNRQKCLWTRDLIICENEFRPKIAKNSLDLKEYLYSPTKGTNKNRAIYRAPINYRAPLTRSYENRATSRSTPGLEAHYQKTTIPRVEVQIPKASKPTSNIEVQIYNPKNPNPNKNSTINNSETINSQTTINSTTNNSIFYTIKETILNNLLGSIERPSNNFLLTTSTMAEPNSFKEAMNSPEKEIWYKACLEEVKELESQNTYTIINNSLPLNIKPLKGMWVFKKKPINNPSN